MPPAPLHSAGAAHLETTHQDHLGENQEEQQPADPCQLHTGTVHSSIYQAGAILPSSQTSRWQRSLKYKFRVYAQ